MSPADRAMLAAISHELTANPFASVIYIGDAELPRKAARDAEQRLLRMEREARRSA